jgi:hypothetical protein
VVAFAAVVGVLVAVEPPPQAASSGTRNNAITPT